MNRTRIKICGIASIDEAQLAIAHGVDAIGLLGDMPTSPRGIDLDSARGISLRVPPTVETFLLTASLSGSEIADRAAHCGTTAIQVARHIDVAEYRHIIEKSPSVRRVQVVHVEDETALDLINVYEPYVHAFILDSGSATASVSDLGGTGRIHDWRLSSEFVRRSCKPVFLAGGLNPGNVSEAISTVEPFGVDLCSGVRRKNELDAQLLDNFTRNVWGL